MIPTFMRFVATLAIVAAVSACDDDPVVNAIPAPGGTFAFVTTTDFQTGSASVVWTGNPVKTDVAVASIHSDAVARFAGGRVYVVNRFGADNIQILDPANAFATVGQFSVGNGADPHDIAVVSATKAYVTRYNETDLWIVNPSTGARTGAVSLAALADGDGVPEMDQLYLSGNRLFVSVQRIDRNTTTWNPVGTSFLAVVDVEADSLLDTDPGTAGVQSIALGATNPFSAVAMDATTGNLYVACAGDWGVADSGVEAVDPTTMQSAGILLTGADAGGDVTDVVVVDAQTAYAIMTDATFSNKLLRFNPSTGAVTDTVYAPGAFVLNDVELSPDGMLFLTDRTATAPGIRVYDSQSGDEATTTPISVGLPPFKIVFGSTQ